MQKTNAKKLQKYNTKPLTDIDGGSGSLVWWWQVTEKLPENSLSININLQVCLEREIKVKKEELLSLEGYIPYA